MQQSENKHLTTEHLYFIGSELYKYSFPLLGASGHMKYNSIIRLQHYDLFLIGKRV